MFNNNNNKKPYASRMVMSGKKQKEKGIRLSIGVGMNPQLAVETQLFTYAGASCKDSIIGI